MWEYSPNIKHEKQQKLTLNFLKVFTPRNIIYGIEVLTFVFWRIWYWSSSDKDFSAHFFPRIVLSLLLLFTSRWYSSYVPKCILYSFIWFLSLSSLGDSSTSNVIPNVLMFENLFLKQCLLRSIPCKNIYVF